MSAPDKLPITIEFNVPAAMRDGVILRANVLRPLEGEPYPVVLIRTPYGKDYMTTHPVIDAIRLARTGYIVVIQDVRGRADSEGDFEPFRTEGVDGYDSVEWAATLPGSTGVVGMAGLSYLGLTQWMAAAQHPPHLKAIVPAQTWMSRRDGLATRGGALELGTAAQWYIGGLAPDVMIKRYKNSMGMEALMAAYAIVTEINRLSSEGYWSLPLGTFEPFERIGWAQDTFKLAYDADATLDEIVSIADAYDQVTVPSLNIGGWYDLFSNGALQNFAAMRKSGATPEARQSKLLVGVWTHGTYTNTIGQMDFGVAAHASFLNLTGDLTQLTRRWFDYWLKGIDNGIMNDAPVSVFIMGENTWRDEQEWPLARTQYTPYYLHGNGGLSTQPQSDESPDHYSYDPADPPPTVGGAHLLPDIFPDGVVDQRPVEARPDVLVYTSDVLTKDTEVTGPITVNLWAATDGPDTDFVARLVDVHPDGFARNLTDGIIRARFRNGMTPELLEPNQPYEFTIDLWSTANVFKAGHRIRLDIASASFPRWDRNANTGGSLLTETHLRCAQQTIYHDADHPSHVILPVIPR